MERRRGDDLEVTVEKTVMLALSRLQRPPKDSKKPSKAAGVSCKKVAEFLRANFPWVDGDVESQVMTVFLSCIKTGLVCALENRKYLLLGASPNNIISNCYSRKSHGPNCRCETTLKCLLKNPPKSCCVVKKSCSSTKKLKKVSKIKSALKLKQPKKKITPDIKKSLSKTRTKTTCAQTAQQQIGTSLSAISLNEKADRRCSYCLEFHPPPKGKLCSTCFPYGVPPEVPTQGSFSPRDEKTRASESNHINIK